MNCFIQLVYNSYLFIIVGIQINCFSHLKAFCILTSINSSILFGFWFQEFVKYTYSLPLCKNKRIRIASDEAKLQQSFVSYVLVVQQLSGDLKMIPLFIDNLRAKISPLKYWMWFCDNWIKKDVKWFLFLWCPMILLHL